MYTLFAGPPDDINDININEITACSFTVKWSKSFSNDLCGPVWYTVIMSTGGMVINTDNTTLTNYTVTGLNDNTAYHVSVTANNNAGSSSATSVMTMTNSNGKFVEIDNSPFAELCPYMYCMCKFSIFSSCIM